MGGGQGQGSFAPCGLACPSHNLPSLTGVVKPAKPVLVSVRAKWQSPELQQQARQQMCRSLGPERQRGSSRPASPAQRSLHCLGSGWCSPPQMSFLSLECCVSGLTRAPPSMSLPSCWGQSAFCLAVSLCKKPEVGLRNKTEGREGGKMASSTLRSCGTKKPLLGKKGFIKRLGSCEHVCLTEVKEDQRQAWTSLRTHRDSLRTLV